MSGKANIEVTLGSEGNSAHAIAGNATGVINVIGGEGGISSGAASDISSVLTKALAPGGSDNLNCLVARFIVKNGVAHDNGILVDTSETTVSGKGEINFGMEVLNLNLRAKTKGVNVGVLLPAAHVGGTFTSPDFSMDPTSAVQIAGLLVNGTLDAGVPEVSAPNGQNACLYTLEHPPAQTAQPGGVLSPSITGRARDTLNSMGGALKGLLGQ